MTLPTQNVDTCVLCGNAQTPTVDYQHDFRRRPFVVQKRLQRLEPIASPLRGEALELVFESTAVTRSLIARIRDAVQRQVPVDAVAEVAPLVARLDAFKAGQRRTGTSIAAPSAPAVEDAPSPRAVEEAASPEVAGAPGEPRKGRGGAAIRDTIKVDVDRVDSVVELIGELIIAESMLVHELEREGLASLRARTSLSQVAKISRDLQTLAMRIRMVPVRGVFQKISRMVRELAKKSGKDVEFVSLGEGTEMDRGMVDALYDPLVHMVRNAIDHGIEKPDERRGAGKSPTARLTLHAFHEGGNIIVEITDDGRGLQRDKILKKARERGLVRADESLTDTEIDGLIFLPGFSTAGQLTDISGRGVGMDVVKKNIEALRGRVQLQSRPGLGMTVRLLLPLTLAIIDGMLVKCGAESYIIPSVSIIESLRPDASMLRSLGGREDFVNVRGEVIPMVHLGALIGAEGAIADPTRALVVVVESGDRKLGVVIDDVVAQQQVVIKALDGLPACSDYVSGAAILSDGRVGLILNVDRLSTITDRLRGSSQSRPTPEELRA
jgi:two-component system chemotaxis sensor kinase CheA